MNTEDIAKVCHAANKAYCEANNDNSQKEWDEAAQWQRNSANAGVIFRINHPDAGEDTQHNAWMKDKVDAGWVYGEVKDEDAKTHPCIVPFEQLPKEQQAKDKLFCGIVDALKGLVYFLLVAVFLFSCKKTSDSGKPLPELIAMNEQTQQITGGTSFDNHIASVVQKGDTTIATYNNAPIVLYVIRTSNPNVDKLILKYNQKSVTALGKTIPLANSITYQVTDQGGLIYDQFTTNLQGTAFGNYSITNAYPVHLWLGGDDRTIKDCMQHMFSLCTGSFYCIISCGVRIWVCSFGWHMECFRRALMS